MSIANFRKGEIIMTFKENINRICKEQHTFLSTVIKEIGLSTSKATAINNGYLPKEEIMNQLAEKLNCSVSDFFASEHDLMYDLNEDEKDIITVYRKLNRKKKHEFMAIVYDFEKGKAV